MEKENAKNKCVSLMKEYDISISELISAIVLNSVGKEREKREDELFEYKILGA